MEIGESSVVVSLLLLKISISVRHEEQILNLHRSSHGRRTCVVSLVLNGWVSVIGLSS